MNLRLFVSPDDRREAPPGISPRMRLAEFADRYFFPVVLPKAADPKLERAHERTRREYRTTLAYWRRHTSDPPLEEISAAHCAAFLGTLQTLPGRRGPYVSAETLYKHRRNLRALLRKAGPRRWDREADELNAGLLADLPPVRKVQRPELAEKPFLTPEQLAEVWKACDAMTAPRIAGADPPHWWRVAIRTFYELGLRAEETFEELDWSFVQDRGGQTFIVIPASSRKNRRKSLTAHVSPELLALWRSLRKGKSRLILRATNPHTGRPFGQRYLYQQWRKLLANAGIAGPDLGFHAIRRSHGNSLDSATAQASLGHSDRAVTARYQSALDTSRKKREQLPEFWKGDDPQGEAPSR